MFTVEHHADSVVIAPRCHLDLLTRKSFKDAIDLAGTSSSARVIISLEFCEYLDSSALGTLANASKKYVNRITIVVPPSGRMARIFTVTDFRKVVPIFETIAEALAQVS